MEAGGGGRFASANGGCTSDETTADCTLQDAVFFRHAAAPMARAFDAGKWPAPRRPPSNKASKFGDAPPEARTQ
eukprot:5362231-Pyramimonas_sp.AAC.1